MIKFMPVWQAYRRLEITNISLVRKDTHLANELSKTNENIALWNIINTIVDTTLVS